MKTWWRNWDWFWFAPLRPDSLGFLRLLSGLMLVYTHVVWGIKLEAFFGPDGFQDPVLVQSELIDSTAISFWWWVPAEHLRTAHAACLTILTLYALGVCTRVTAWLAFLISISYSNRAVHANFGLDQINAFVTCYCAIGASGGAFSFDRWWQRLREGLNSLDLTGQWKVSPIQPSVSTRVATRLIQIHLSIVYLWAGFGKLKGTTWWDGNALWYGLANGEYKTHEMLWVAWHPWISNIVTHLTILWECSFIIFVWVPRLTPVMLALGIGMHLGIGSFMGLWTFALIMMFTYIAFIPPIWFEHLSAYLFNLLPGIVSREIVVNPARTWSRLRGALLKSFDPTDRLTVAVVGQPMPALPQEQVVYSIAEWWSEVRKSPPQDWPFVNTDHVGGNRLRVLLLGNQSFHSLQLQEQFSSHGFECRLAADVITACSMLSVRPSDTVVMLLNSSEDVEDYVAFRQMAMNSEGEGPTSILLLGAGLPNQRVWQSSDSHRVLAEPIEFEDLAREVTATWGEDFPPCQCCQERRAAAQAGVSRQPTKNP